MRDDLLLESIEKHISLSERDKGLMLSLFRERRVKKGQFIVHEGAVSRCTNFVIEGSVRTYFVDLNGQEHIVQFAIEGWWISDLNSFIMQVPATFNVQAIEDSVVLELPFENLEILYERVPKMERYFRVLTQRAFVAFQQRVVQNISMTAEERYLAFQQKYPKIELRIPQKLVASYLGISAEFLSKTKKRLMESRASMSKSKPNAR
jgi:CRP/FNR family transcriptional regulator, anaerobic regulatory protein